jgi:maleylacetate reductase
VFRFGAGALVELADVAVELGLERLLLVTTRRGAASAGDAAVVAVYEGVRPHVPVETVREVAALARELGADGLVGLGGGSAIDTCKAVAVELLPDFPPDAPCKVIAVPTTYAGAEWTPFYGLLLGPGRKGGGGDHRARPSAAIYDPRLTLGLPRAETVGTSMNALAHCAEAYYSPFRTDRADRHADCGATAVAYALPLVVRTPGAVYGRTRLLDGAMRAAMALGEAGLCLGHAMAQALGGRYGLPQGEMNAICLPEALRFNAAAVPEQVARFGRALGTDDPAARVEELAALGGFPLRLREHGVPEEDLPALAEAVVARPGAQANPRPAAEPEVEELLRALW